MGQTNLKVLSTEPSVFQYHDYREFLRDWVNHLKNNKGLSMRKLAKDCGFSHGYLSLVIDRKRNLSSDMTLKLMPHLRFSKDQMEFFDAMITLSDEKNSKKKNDAYKIMQSKIKYNKINIDEPVTYKYLDHWLNVALREYATTSNLSKDPKKIKNLIPYKVSLREIEKSIHFLIKNDFLIEGKDSVLIATQKDISCLGGIYQLSLGNFHKNMLDMAKIGIDVHAKADRKQSGYTAAVSRENFEEIKNIMDEAKQKIKQLERSSRNSSKDTVYHVNFSAFPLIGGESK